MDDWDFLYDMRNDGHSQEEQLELKAKNKERIVVKRIFLVDFENVHTGGIKGIKTLSEQDDIFLFYSGDHNESIAVLRELRDDIHYAKIIKNGQNALDFQLSSFLGFTIKEAASYDKLANTQLYIISKDSGYDAVIDFWTKTPFAKHLGVSPSITRADNIHLALHPAKNKLPSDGKQVTVPTIPINKRQLRLDELIRSTKTYTDFHSALVKEFGMPDGSVLYKDNKARFKELKKL
ncbi:MAG: hypothetical protein LBP92_04370 [Deltaproteobacteria bacterium]|jgi:hypothetical protein|nr:hypothetical protein [Deltaproteobacteria bacterium]